MELDDVVKAVLNEAKTQLDEWHWFRKKLKDRGFKDDEQQLDSYKYKADIGEAESFLKVLDKLEEKFDYKIKDFSDYLQRYQFEKILELSRLKGDVLGMLDALACTGYKLGSVDVGSFFIIHKPYIEAKNYDLFKSLLKNNLFEKYLAVFKAFRNAFGCEYKDFSRSKQSEHIDNIIKFSELDGDVRGAIYILASNNYMIEQETESIQKDMKKIEKIVKALENEKSENPNIVYLYLYKKSDTELFKKIFSDLSTEEKRSALEAIFNCDQHNEKTIKWLEDEYSDLIKEVGFS